MPASYRLWPAAVLLLLLPASQGLSQSRRVDFDHLSIEDGLSQGTVFSILQDHQGYMWFGTADGLNKFDGYSFTHYVHDVNDSTSISDNRAIALAEDRSGRLWVGTIGGGLNLFDRASGTFRRFRANRNDSLSLSDDRVNSLFLDSQGIIWVGTTVAGVNAFDPSTGRFRRFLHDPADPTSLSDNHVFPITEDRGGLVWIGTPSGVNLFDRESGTFTHLRMDPDDPSSLSSDYINAIHCDRSGTVWVGTVEGLNRLDGIDTLPAGSAGGRTGTLTTVRGRFTRFIHDPGDSTSLGSKSVWSIFEDRSGSLWVGTDGGGLNRLDRTTGKFERYVKDINDPRSLSETSVRSLYQDASGTLWVGTNIGGLNTWNPRRMKFITHTVLTDSKKSLSSGWIHALREDRRGRLWIGNSSSTLDVLDLASGRFRRFPLDGSVEAFCEDTVGERMWVGSRTGLFEFNTRTLGFKHITYTPPDPDTLSSRRVRVLRGSRDGTLWIGIMGRGIVVADPRDWTITRYTRNPSEPGSLGDDLVRSIHEDHAGIMWAGTYAGLDRFDPQTRTFTHFRHRPGDPQSLSNDNILSLFDFPRDSGRVLWVGTFGGGLNRLETSTGRVQRYTTREGLPNNVIYGILGDSRGGLWVTTNRGIAQLNPANGRIRVFDVNDGLQGNEFAMGAAHSGRNGMMYVGGVEGFSMFHPDSIVESTFVPLTVITAIRKIDEDFHPGASAVELGPGDKYITFEFASLDYTNPHQNRYAYRLVGFDEKWTTAGTRRSATFTNLDAGTYTFEVKGTNSDGVWNDTPAVLRVEVVPPFWKSWWFLLLAAIALLLFGSAAYKRRLAAYVEKARIVGELQSARALQLGLLPGSDPAFEGLDISGACIPAMEVGGDFFEFLGGESGNDNLTVALGDVSGKGMNAAMTAVMAIGMLPHGKELSRSPAEILCAINTKLYLKTDKRSFVALLLATFERPGPTLRFANAGQSMPIRRRDGELKLLAGAGDRFPLGVIERPRYEDCHVDLRSGDLLVFTSDGATDARRSDGSFFDQAGVEQVVRGLPQEASAREMVQRIIRAVQEVHGDRQAHDDLTVVVVKVR